MHDIAQTLVGLCPQDRRIFVHGYTIKRKLPINYQDLIECFFIMTCVENVSFHSNDPKELEELKSQHPYMMKLIGNYIEDKPFLFQL